MTRTLRKTTAAMVLVCGGVSACGYTGIEGGQPIASGLQAEMLEIRRRIEREVGAAPAQRLAQCRAMPIGAKPCGGPQSYVVYSTAASSEQKLQELARQYTEAEQKYNRVTETFGTCVHVMPPEVHLRNGTCTSNPPLASPQ